MDLLEVDKFMLNQSVSMSWAAGTGDLAVTILFKIVQSDLWLTIWMRQSVETGMLNLKLEWQLNAQVCLTM